MQRSLPSWVVFWLFVTGVVCTIDGLFIILRPHTLPDGKWNYLVKPCKSNEQSQDWARFPYNNPLNLLRMQQFHTLSLLFLTNSLIWIESKHVCIINVWGYTEILLVACLRNRRFDLKPSKANAEFRKQTNSIVELRFNEVPRDGENLFVMSRVHYIENLDVTNFWITWEMFVLWRYS